MGLFGKDMVYIWALFGHFVPLLGEYGWRLGPIWMRMTHSGDRGSYLATIREVPSKSITKV